MAAADAPGSIEEGADIGETAEPTGAVGSANGGAPAGGEDPADKYRRLWRGVVAQREREQQARADTLQAQRAAAAAEAFERLGGLIAAPSTAEWRVEPDPGARPHDRHRLCLVPTFHIPEAPDARVLVTIVAGADRTTIKLTSVAGGGAAERGVRLGATLAEVEEALAAVVFDAVEAGRSTRLPQPPAPDPHV